MSLVDIYTEIETRVKASATFTGYNFFRHYSKKAVGNQSKARIPFISLTFDEETSRKTKQWGISSRAVFTVIVRWATAYADLDALGRITEFSTRKTALLKALLATTDVDYLNLPYVMGMEITTEQARYGVAPEEIIDNGLKSTISVDYFEGRA